MDAAREITDEIKGMGKAAVEMAEAEITAGEVMAENSTILGNFAGLGIYMSRMVESKG